MSLFFLTGLKTRATETGHLARLRSGAEERQTADLQAPLGHCTAEQAPFQSQCALPQVHLWQTGMSIFGVFPFRGWGVQTGCLLTQPISSPRHKDRPHLPASLWWDESLGLDSNANKTSEKIMLATYRVCHKVMDMVVHASLPFHGSPSNHEGKKGMSQDGKSQDPWRSTAHPLSNCNMSGK